MPDLHGLPTEFAKFYAGNVVTAEEWEYLIKLATYHFQFKYGDLHGLSYFLDPVVLGEGLPSLNRCSLEDLLINPPTDDAQPVDDQCNEQLYLEYKQFKIAVTKEKTQNSFRFPLLATLLAKPRKTPLVVVDRRQRRLRAQDDRHQTVQHGNVDRFI
jgi:hypothetical protein